MVSWIVNSGSFAQVCLNRTCVELIATISRVEVAAPSGFIRTLVRVYECGCLKVPQTLLLFKSRLLGPVSPLDRRAILPDRTHGILQNKRKQ